MASDEKTPYVLRPEARPLRWDLLNASQQSAFCKILAALEDARRDVDQASEQKPEEMAPPNLPATPDRFRSSRLIFISGKRGTGKSTVLVSLFEAFLNPNRFCVVGDAPGAAIKAKKESAEAIKKDVEELKNRLIWLDPLDMEPLPMSVNLLAAILARIDRAVARFNQKRDDKSYQSGLLSLASGEKALHGLRKLASDVAIAWDGNVDDRASALDPDAYAAEVTRVEDARVGINVALNKALDELAQELGKSSYVKNPLFVLPVDDYDLNPLRSLELLHLIRMVSSPRLFIVVLGDVRTAEIMFNLKKSGDFARVLAAAASRPKSLSVSSAEVGSIARSLSGHAIRKLVPPGQRIELGPLTINEALRFHPSHLGNARGDYEEEDLKRLLECLPIDIETAIETPAKPPLGYRQESIAGKTISNFGQFLWFDVLAERPSTRSRSRVQGVDGPGEDQPYTGAALLKAAPRYIADLWFSIRELLRSGKQELPRDKESWDTRLYQLIDLIGRETHRALEEDELLSVSYRERFIDALGGGATEGWLQAMSFVEARSVFTPGRLVPLRNQGCALHANLQRSWAFRDLEKRRDVEIGDRTKALIVLLHDLLTLDREGGIVGSHVLSPDSLNLNWGFASWNVGQKDEIKVPWVTPAWTSFWEFEQFSRIWTSAIRKGKIWDIDRIAHTGGNTRTASAESTRKAFLLYTWIDGVNRIFRRADAKPETPIAASLSVSDLHKASNWQSLAKEINSLIVDSRMSNTRAERIKTWLIRLPLILAPESGLVPVDQDSETLKECMDAFSDTIKWEDLRKEHFDDAIRSMRADRLVLFPKNIQDDFLPPLDAHIDSIVSRREHLVNRVSKGALRPDYDDIVKADERREK